MPNDQHERVHHISKIFEGLEDDAACVVLYEVEDGVRLYISTDKEEEFLPALKWFVSNASALIEQLEKDQEQERMN